MSRFVSYSDTRQVRAEWWDADEFVILRRLSWGDKQKVASESAQITPLTSNGKNKTASVQATLRVDTFQLQMLQLGIVSWTFKDEAGNVVPVTPENLNRLEERDGEFILNALDEFNTLRPEAEQATFRPQIEASGEGSGTVSG